VRSGPLPITISVGIASFDSPSDTLDELLKRADLALYRAKREGRNRVIADAA
jgi:two-component system cell cycle response regulator